MDHGWSKRQADGCLQAARNILLRRHGAERSAGGRCVGDAKADLIKDVQSVDARLQADRFVNRDLLDKRRVGGVECPGADSGEGRRERDQVVGQLLRGDAVENACVKPLCRGAVGAAKRDILRELTAVVTEVTGKEFRLFRAGGPGMLGTLIKVARTVAPGEKELYPAWQGMQRSE